MSAHIVFSAWDADHPATCSKTVIDTVIRGRIGFDGLLLSDDIDMQALDGTIPDRGAAALAAGCDIILNCWAKMDDQQEIANRFTSLTDAAQARLARVHEAMGDMPEGVDTPQLLARRDALLAIAEAAL